MDSVTFYDNTAASGTVILAVNVDPSESPVFIRFGREAGIYRLACFPQAGPPSRWAR